MTNSNFVGCSMGHRVRAGHDDIDVEPDECLGETAEPRGRRRSGVNAEDQTIAPMFAGFVILVCGLAALLYLITKRRSMPPLEPEKEREKYRYLRDTPLQ